MDQALALAARVGHEFARLGFRGARRETTPLTVRRSKTSFALLFGVIGWICVLGCGARSSLDLFDGIGSPNDSGTGSESGASSGCGSPSCAPGGPGMTNCGPSTECCCTSPEVTGGTYYRTYVNTGAGPTGEADPAAVSAFRLDKYLVTVGRFRQFVAAWNAGYYPSAGSGKHTHLNGGNGLANVGSGGGYETGWDATWNDTTSIDPTTANLGGGPPYSTWTPTPSTQENLPINSATWYEAYAFCIWDGGFLPSEAEWEYAAAGGDQQREYPWGSTEPGPTNQYAIYNYFYTGNSTGGVAPVGFAAQGAALWGQFDMAGDLYEWNLDWYATFVDPCTDCANVTAASNRVLRGGDFTETVSSLFVSDRFNGSVPSDRDFTDGFRCARTP